MRALILSLCVSKKRLCVSSSLSNPLLPRQTPSTHPHNANHPPNPSTHLPVGDVDVNRIFVVHQPSGVAHRRVQQPIALFQRAAAAGGGGGGGGLGEGAGVGEGVELLLVVMIRGLGLGWGWGWGWGVGALE